MAECQFIRDSRLPSHPLLSMIATHIGQRGRIMPHSGIRVPRGDQA